MGTIIIRKYSVWKRQKEKASKDFRIKREKSKKRAYTRYVEERKAAIEAKRIRQAQRPTIVEAQKLADPSTGKIYVKVGHDEYRKLTPEQWSSKTYGELTSYKPRTKAEWERSVGREERHTEEAREASRAGEAEIKQKQELLAKSGMVATREAALKARMVSPEEYEAAKIKPIIDEERVRTTVLKGLGRIDEKGKTEKYVKEVPFIMAGGQRIVEPKYIPVVKTLIEDKPTVEYKAFIGRKEPEDIKGKIYGEPKASKPDVIFSPITTGAVVDIIGPTTDVTMVPPELAPPPSDITKIMLPKGIREEQTRKEFEDKIISVPTVPMPSVFTEYQAERRAEGTKIDRTNALNIARQIAQYNVTANYLKQQKIIDTSSLENKELENQREKIIVMIKNKYPEINPGLLLTDIRTDKPLGETSSSDLANKIQKQMAYTPDPYADMLSYPGVFGYEPTTTEATPETALQLQERGKNLQTRSVELEGKVDAFTEWQENTFSDLEVKKNKLESERSSVDIYSSESVDRFNKEREQFMVDLEKSTKEQQNRREQLGLALSMQEDERRKFMGEQEAYFGDYEKQRKRMEAQQVDYDRIMAKRTAWEEKYFDVEKQLQPTRPGETAVPTFITVPKGGIISTFQRNKDAKELDKEYTKYLTKYYSVDTSKTTIPLEQLARATIPPPGWTQEERARVEEFGLKGIEPTGPYKALWATIRGKDIEVLEAQRLAAKQRAKEAMLTGQTLTPERQYDILLQQPLVSQIGTATYKPTLKAIAEIGALGVGLWGASALIGAGTKVPGVVGTISRVAASKPAQTALWGIYGGTEAVQAGLGEMGIQTDIPSRVEAGLERQAGVARRATGVGLGLGLMYTVGPQPIYDAASATKEKLLLPLARRFPYKAPTEPWVPVQPETLLPGAGYGEIGVAAESVVKVDRYGMPYKSYEYGPRVLPEGQLDLFGRPVVDYTKYGPYLGEAQTKITVGPETPAGKLPVGTKISYREGQPVFVGPDGQVIRQVGWKVEGLIPRGGKWIPIEPEVQTTLRYEPGFMGVEKVVGIDTKTGRYKMFEPKDILVEQGQVFIKEGGKWRWANEVVGWKGTTEKGAEDLLKVKSADQLTKEQLKRQLSEVEVRLVDLSKQTALPEYGPVTEKGEFLKAFERNLNKLETERVVAEKVPERKQVTVTEKAPTQEAITGRKAMQKWVELTKGAIQTYPEYQYVPAPESTWVTTKKATGFRTLIQPTVPPKLTPTTPVFLPLSKMPTDVTPIPLKQHLKYDVSTLPIDVTAPKLTAKIQPVSELSYFQEPYADILPAFVFQQTVPQITEPSPIQIGGTGRVVIIEPDIPPDIPVPSVPGEPGPPFPIIKLAGIGALAGAGFLPRGQRGQGGQAAVESWLVSNAIRDFGAEFLERQRMKGLGTVLKLPKKYTPGVTSGVNFGQQKTVMPKITQPKQIIPKQSTPKTMPKGTIKQTAQKKLIKMFGTSKGVSTSKTKNILGGILKNL